MRRGNASWINEIRKKAKCNDKCQIWMTSVYILGFKDMLRLMFILVRLILA